MVKTIARLVVLDRSASATFDILGLALGSPILSAGGAAAGHGKIASLAGQLAGFNPRESLALGA